jgi:hypothetical protein
MWYNAIITAILRSPMHALLSLNLMLITYTGRKSGRRVTVPVTYVRDADTLWVISKRERAWWRSLIGGAEVTLRLRGKAVVTSADAIVDDLETKIAGLTLYVKEYPDVGKAIVIRYDAEKQPNPEDVAREAEKRVLVRIRLAPERERG